MQDGVDLTFSVRGLWRPTQCQLCIAKMPSATADCNDTAMLFDNTVFTSNTFPVTGCQKIGTVVTGPILLTDICGGGSSVDADLHHSVCIYVFDAKEYKLVGFVIATVDELVHLCSQHRWLTARCRRCTLKEHPPLPDGAPPAAEIVEHLKQRVPIGDNRKSLFVYVKTFIATDLLDAIEAQPWCKERVVGDTTRNVALDVANHLVHAGFIQHILGCKVVRDKYRLFRFAGQEGVELNYQECSAKDYSNSCSITAVAHSFVDYHQAVAALHPVGGPPVPSFEEEEEDEEAAVGAFSSQEHLDLLEELNEREENTAEEEARVLADAISKQTRSQAVAEARMQKETERIMRVEAAKHERAQMKLQKQIAEEKQALVAAQEQLQRDEAENQTQLATVQAAYEAQNAKVENARAQIGVGGNRTELHDAVAQQCAKNAALERKIAAIQDAALVHTGAFPNNR